MSTLRGFALLSGFAALTLPLMPVQAVLLRLAPGAARRFPNWYHRQVCRLIGVRLDITGAVVRDRPVLLISNHTSWLDIPVLSAVAPVSFVAKKEVASWPFVSALAKLQRSVFVDRTRRQDAGEAAGEIMARLAAGDTVVLFPEGTSSDGNRVLPFKSSLFGAVSASRAGAAVPANVVVQTVAVVYTHQGGIPVGRGQRPNVAWYGDMEMTTHAWQVLRGPPVTATIAIAPPVPLDQFADRKQLARATERELRRKVTGILRGRPDDPALEGAEPAEDTRRHLQRKVHARTEKWT